MAYLYLQSPSEVLEVGASVYESRGHIQSVGGACDVRVGGKLYDAFGTFSEERGFHSEVNKKTGNSQIYLRRLKYWENIYSSGRYLRRNS